MPRSSRRSPGCSSGPSWRSPWTGSRSASGRDGRGASPGASTALGGALLLGALALLVCWGFGAVALHATGAPRPARGGAAVDDPRRAQRRCCRPRDRCCTCCGGSTRPRRCAGPMPTSRRQTRPRCDDPEVRAVGRLDRARARHRLRARRRGLGLGRGARARRHQRPRRRRRGRHDGEPRRTAPSSTRPPSTTTRATTSPCSRSRASTCRRLALGRRPPRRRRRGDRLPGQRAARLHAGAPRPHRDRDQRGLLRPRSGRSGG